MSANHAGSLDYALDIVRAAKDSGADCVKIQTYTADTMTLNARTDDFMLKSGTWAGYNLYDLYKEAYTPWEWHVPLKEAADKLGIDFLSTPFDRTAVDFLEDLNVTAYKIASFELTDIPLLRYVAKKGKPMFVSTGMASLDEIKEAVDTVFSTGNKRLTLLKCSSAYPALPENMNLSTIPDMAGRFGVPVGLSDHSLGSLSALTAVSLGATVIEKHFCLSREIKNPDSSFSMEPAEFSAMVKDIRDTEKALGAPFYGYTESEKSSVGLRRSVYAAKDIKKGEIFATENVRVIRPANGLHPREYETLLGKRAARDISFATPLSRDMAEE
jgi:pseudaminic acid synthase